MIRRLGSVVVGCTLLLLPVTSAYGEPYVGLHLGVSIPFDTDLDRTGAGSANLRNLSVDESLTFGVKAGLWLTEIPYLGGEIEMYRFSPEIPPQPARGGTLADRIDLDITTFGFNFMARTFLAPDQTMPRGRGQVYAGVGPTLVIAEAETLGGDDSDTTVGVQVLFGLRFFLTPDVAIFTEYKFSHAPLKFTIGATQDKFDINANHLVFGVSLHFR